MSNIIFDIILVLIPVCIGLLTTYFIPWIKQRVGDAKLSTVIKWVEYAVNCAEMIYQKETGKGLDKKQYVVDFIDSQFNKDKTALTKEQIDVLIECAVKSMNDTKTK